METSKSTYYLPSQIKTGMSSATRDPEVKRLGDPDLHALQQERS